MTPPDPLPVRPRLCDRIHAALVKAGRPVTRGELRMFVSHARTVDLQDALDVLLSEGLAVKSEERVRWQRFVTWRAVSVGEDHP
jgi:hypothetical protein